MKTRQQLRAEARAMLGNGIFNELWLMAAVVLFIQGAINSAASSIIPIAALVVFGPLSVGVAKVFLDLARGGKKVNIGDMFEGFTKDFKGNFLLGLLYNLFIYLWSLLLIIPGIVKSYSYALSYYLKNDNPDWTWKQCIDESRRLMNGQKMRLFLLDLSFIGWYIVGALCCGIGTFWVVTYHSAARAAFYNELVPTVVVADSDFDVSFESNSLSSNSNANDDKVNFL